VAPARLRTELGGDPAELDAARRGLERRGLVRGAGEDRLDLTAAGHAAHDRIVEGRRGALAELAEGWGAEREPEVAALLDRLAHAFVSEIPSPRMAAGADGPEAPPRRDAQIGARGADRIPGDGAPRNGANPPSHGAR
jgi:hypothetical protein